MSQPEPPCDLNVLRFDDRQTWPTTMHGMCEVIAEQMLFRHKETGEEKRRTALEVFNYSATGELYMVFVWFLHAAIELELMRRFANGEASNAIADDFHARLAKCHDLEVLAPSLWPRGRRPDEAAR